MLNTKYIIEKAEDGTEAARMNPAALGHAWFVNRIIMVDNANAEIDSLNSFDPAGDAVVHSEFSEAVKGLSPSKNGAIALKSYSPNKLEYEYETQGDQLAVFSEIWYGPDKGWQAYIDGKPAEHIRANYVLRGMKVPGGKHTVTFEFKPKSYYLGETISLVCSGLLLLLLGYVIYSYLRNNKAGTVAAV